MIQFSQMLPDAVSLCNVKEKDGKGRQMCNDLLRLQCSKLIASWKGPQLIVVREVESSCGQTLMNFRPPLQLIASWKGPQLIVVREVESSCGFVLKIIRGIAPQFGNVSNVHPTWYVQATAQCCSHGWQQHRYKQPQYIPPNAWVQWAKADILPYASPYCE